MSVQHDHDGDSEDFDDLPSTHLDDEEYEAFLAREIDAEGRLRGEPRVAFWIGLGIVVLALLALWLFL